MKNYPFVSIVIPTRNRAKLLGDCLKALFSLDYPRHRYEIIVVDDGSTDGTKTVVRGLVGDGTSLLYAHEHHRGLNAARNRGITLAHGELLCLIDDDVVVPQTWLRAMVSGYRRWPDAGCYGGPVKARFEGRVPRYCGRESVEGEGYLGDEERPVHFIGGGNLAIAARVLQSVGLFDDRLSGWGDDVEWEQRHLAVGGRVIYLPDAWLWHRRSAQDLHFWHLAQKRFRRGQERATFFRIHGNRLALGIELYRIARVLAHAAFRRCAWGIFAAVEHLGYICGILGLPAPRDAGHPPEGFSSVRIPFHALFQGFQEPHSEGSARRVRSFS